MRGLRVLLITLILFLPSLAFGVDTESELFSLSFDSFQESSLILDVGNLGNNIEESDTSHATTIIDSYKDNTGLFNINQASGSLNNQANIAIETFTPGKGLLDIQLDTINTNTDNTVKISGISHRESLIENSFENSRGLFMVNQSPGNLNQQSNIFILSLGGALVLKDMELASVTGNNVIEYDPGADIERKDVLRNSFSGSSVVAIINQSSGDLNAIRNTLAISFSSETVK